MNSKLVYSSFGSVLTFAKIGFLALVGLGFLIFLLSLFHEKLIGVELMNTLQMFFFYLFLADTINIDLMPIQ